jgi:uncharacterized membrane protein
MTSASQDSQNISSTRSLSLPVLLTSITILYIAARLWRLTASCLWFDEIFSVHAARHSWRGLLGFAAADVVHPPLFYALLKIWIAIGGESLGWLRLLPFLFSVAAIVPLVLLSRALKLRNAETNLALLLLAVNGYLIKYAQELRMYSLLFFLALCSFWLFVRFIQGSARKFLIAMSAVNVLLIYTHYYGWIVLASEFVFVLIWQRARVKSFLISIVAPSICFIPWAWAVISASRGQALAQNIGWAARPRLSDLMQLFVLLNDPFFFRQSSAEDRSPWAIVISLTLFGLPILFLLWRRWKQGDKIETSLRPLVSFIMLPLLFAFGLSWILPQSVWGTRHLIVIAAPYALLTAVALIRLRPVETKFTFLILIGGWFVFAAGTTLMRPTPVYVWCAWNDLAQRLKQQPAAIKPANIYAFEDLTAYHLWFALDANPQSSFHVGVIKDLPGLAEDKAYFLPRDFNDISVRKDFPRDESHFWIAFRDVMRDETHPPLKTATDLGYEVKTVFETNAGGQREFLIELIK